MFSNCWGNSSPNRSHSNNFHSIAHAKIALDFFTPRPITVQSFNQCLAYNFVLPIHLIVMKMHVNNYYNILKCVWRVIRVIKIFNFTNKLHQRKGLMTLMKSWQRIQIGFLILFATFTSHNLDFLQSQYTPIAHLIFICSVLETFCY